MTNPVLLTTSAIMKYDVDSERSHQRMNRQVKMRLPDVLIKKSDLIAFV